jgi:GT2 family glycosyltransferase
MKRLSVIIPRFANTAPVHEITNQTIDTVLKNKSDKFDTEVVVVDDGSLIQLDRRDDIWLYRNEVNSGVAHSWNLGIKNRPNSDFYCFLNSDCLVEPGWDFPLVVAAEQMPVVAMPFTNGEQSDGVGVTGWCFLTSKQIFDRIGLFDESFSPAYYEDTDWFHRAINLDIALVNVEGSNVRHTRGQGGTGWLKRKDYLHLSNRFRYAWKHGVDPNDIPPFWKEPLPIISLDKK